MKLLWTVEWFFSPSTPAVTSRRGPRLMQPPRPHGSRVFPWLPPPPLYLAAAPTATTRPCHQLELLCFWNPELWNSPFWPQPLILLSALSLSCPWNTSFGLIGTPCLLTFPCVSSTPLPPGLFPLLPCWSNHFNSTLKALPSRSVRFLFYVFFW